MGLGCGRIRSEVDRHRLHCVAPWPHISQNFDCWLSNWFVRLSSISTHWHREPTMNATIMRRYIAERRNASDKLSDIPRTLDGTNR